MILRIPSKLAVLSFLLFFFPIQEILGQAPDSINYQAVARDDQGEVLANEDLQVRLGIYAGSSGGNLLYEEEHDNVSTDQFGLFTLHIGGGSQVDGSASSFGDIDWGANSLYLEVEVNAGSGYESLGSREFVSVPYALHAKEAGSVGDVSLQKAYEGGNQISLDAADLGPLFFEENDDTLFYAEGTTVGMGTHDPLSNPRLDVRHVSGLADSEPAPGILSVSAPVTLSASDFNNASGFDESNTGILGVGVGTEKAVGVTGFTMQSSGLSTFQDSIYGVTGIVRDEQGGVVGSGVSGVAQAQSTNVRESVGVYGRTEGDGGVDLQNANVLAGGVFEAAIYGPADTTLGAVGLGGLSGDHNIGVFGSGRGSNGIGNNYGVIGMGGVGDTNVGVLGVGDTINAGVGIAGWFRNGRTIVEDTLQVPYGNPSAGEVLTAYDATGKAYWDTLPLPVTPITLQSVYENGDSISLNSGGEIHVQNDPQDHSYLYVSDGSPTTAVGHEQPIGSTSPTGGTAEEVPLHVANEGPNPGHLLISGGDDNNLEDAVLSFSENIGSVNAGAEIRFGAGFNELTFGAEVGGGDPVMGITTGSSSHGLIVGGGYLGGLEAPPAGGMIVEDSVGIGTPDPDHKHHIEGRTFSSEGFLTVDTAEYRYDAPKEHYYGLSGDEFRASGAGTANDDYSITDDGELYFPLALLSGAGRVSAPVHLPDGAKVQEITYYYYDDSGNEIDLSFERVPYGSGSTSTVSGTDHTSNDGGGGQFTVTPSGSLQIDNENNAYRIIATFSGPADQNLMVSNVRIRYTVTKAD